MAGAARHRALPQLIDPGGYRACDWDLLADPVGRGLWLDVFEKQTEYITRCAIESGYDAADVERAERLFTQRLAALRDDPRAFGDRLDILTMDRVRDGVWRDGGVDDAFRAVKARENERALPVLASRCAAIDAMPEPDRLEALVRGVFAGNLFDMGASATAALFLSGAGPAFSSCLARAPARPWGIDGLAGATLDGWRHAVLFVDNAGADAVLGMLPLARELVRRGARVTLAANETPSLNDITARELEPIVRGAAEFREMGDRGVLEVLSTGSADPLIELSHLEGGFCQRVADADLVVLEGMGRGLESNWNARLSCETWRVAVVKTEAVARRRGVAMYDGVFRRDAASGA